MGDLPDEGHDHGADQDQTGDGGGPHGPDVVVHVAVGQGGGSAAQCLAGQGGAAPPLG